MILLGVPACSAVNLLSLTTVIQTEISRLLIEGAGELGVFLTDEHIAAFERYIDELKVWAEHMNLIRRKDEREIVMKDFLDSLTVIWHLSESASHGPGIGSRVPRNPGKNRPPGFKDGIIGG